jgi:hypothetical protein
MPLIVVPCSSAARCSADRCDSVTRISIRSFAAYGYIGLWPGRIAVTVRPRNGKAKVGEGANRFPLNFHSCTGKQPVQPTGNPWRFQVLLIAVAGSPVPRGAERA